MACGTSGPVAALAHSHTHSDPWQPLSVLFAGMVASQQPAVGLGGVGGSRGSEDQHMMTATNASILHLTRILPLALLILSSLVS